jgi:hypothetical protein
MAENSEFAAILRDARLRKCFGVLLRMRIEYEDE